MLPRGLLALLLVSPLGGCLAYEFEHELWLRVDGSGSVDVTGRPELWAAFKGVGDPERPAETVTTDSLRALFEASGLRVRAARLTRRGGRDYLFVSADFDDVDRLAGSPAFPDLAIRLRRGPERSWLEGSWRRAGTARVGAGPDELVAMRFHLPSRVYAHHNAVRGVERGNILSWQTGLGAALEGEPLDFGAELGSTSVLRGTLSLFLGAALLAAGLVTGLLWLLWWRGRRALRRPPEGSGA